MSYPVYLILVTYNGAGDIPAFFESLSKYTSKTNIQVVVIDNASADNSVELVKKYWPTSHLIQNSENNGFSGGSNQGMQYALENGAKYILLANQDVRFESNWLENLVNMMEQNPKLGAVQPIIMMDQNKELINSYGNALHYLGLGYTRGYLKTEREFLRDNKIPLGYLSGAVLLISAEALKTVGLFPDFFMYHEDTDLCWRLRLAGYELAVCETARVYHHYEFSRSIKKFYYIERNRIIMILQNYRLGTLLLLLPSFIALELAMDIYSLLKILKATDTIGIKEKLRGYGYFFHISTWREIVKQRRNIAKMRKVSDRKIINHFTPYIIFQDVDNPVIRYILNPCSYVYWTLVKCLIFW